MFNCCLLQSMEKSPPVVDGSRIPSRPPVRHYEFFCVSEKCGAALGKSIGRANALRPPHVSPSHCPKVVSCHLFVIGVVLQRRRIGGLDGVGPSLTLGNLLSLATTSTIDCAPNFNLECDLRQGR